MSDIFDEFALPEPPRMPTDIGGTFDQAGIDALFGFDLVSSSTQKSGLKAVIQIQRNQP